MGMQMKSLSITVLTASVLGFGKTSPMLTFCYSFQDSSTHVYLVWGEFSATRVWLL